MLTLLTLTALATGPTTGLTLSAQLGKSPTPPAVHLDTIEQELVAAGLAVRRLTTACDGARDCLLAAAGKENVQVLVGVSIAQRRKQTTFDIEAIRADDGATVAQATFVVTERLGEADRAQVRDFAARVKQAMPAPVADVPVRDPEPTKLAPEPAPVPPPIIVTEPPPPPGRSRVPAWVLLGGAGAAAVTSGLFLGLATDARGRVESTPDPSPLTRAQAQGLAADANRHYTIALVTGAAAGALATGALVWLLTE
ncbi:MAG: hypothetical protein AB1730_04610 [Myxococcota bacterium]|jgi:hypothetical protein